MASNNQPKSTQGRAKSETLDSLYSARNVVVAQPSTCLHFMLPAKMMCYHCERMLSRKASTISFLSNPEEWSNLRRPKSYPCEQPFSARHQLHPKQTNSGRSGSAAIRYDEVTEFIKKFRTCVTMVTPNAATAFTATTSIAGANTPSTSEMRVTDSCTARTGSTTTTKCAKKVLEEAGELSVSLFRPCNGWYKDCSALIIQSCQEQMKQCVLSNQKVADAISIGLVLFESSWLQGPLYLHTRGY